MKPAAPAGAPPGRRSIALAVLVAALGYFVDIYDLILFSIVRVRSLTDIGVPPERMLETGVLLLNTGSRPHSETWRRTFAWLLPGGMSTTASRSPCPDEYQGRSR